MMVSPLVVITISSIALLSIALIITITMMQTSSTLNVISILNRENDKVKESLSVTPNINNGNLINISIVSNWLKSSRVIGVIVVDATMYVYCKTETNYNISPLEEIIITDCQNTNMNDKRVVIITALGNSFVG